MTPDSARQDSRILVILSFACFGALGVAAGLLGVAWPSLRAEFGLSLDAIAAVLASSTVGFVVGSVIAGNVISRRGIVPYLLTANVLAAIGLLGYAVSPGWWVFVAVGLLAGLGSGMLDTGLNIFMAGSQSVRTMNWMHACFGIGAAIGPLVMTAVLTAGLSWRLGYAFIGVAQLALAVAYVPLLRRDYSTAHQSARIPEVGQTAENILDAASPLSTLRMLAVWLAVLLFFLYTGVEATAGQWTFTLFTESRGVTTAAAGALTSIFWAMLTLGRIVFGAGAQRIGINRLLRLSMIATVFASLLVVIGTVWTGFVGIAMMGLSLSAIFPTLTSETPHRVGIRHAANAIGYQTGAASIGFAVMPGLAGVLAERAGLESIGWVLVVGSLLMLVANELAIAIAHRDVRRRIMEREVAGAS